MSTSVVFEMSHLTDVMPSFQRKDRIMSLLRIEDESFYKKIRDGGGSFSYGDKYFADLKVCDGNGDLFLLCIPLESKNIYRWLKKNVKSEWRRISIDFEKMKPLMQKSGKFYIH